MKNSLCLGQGAVHISKVAKGAVWKMFENHGWAMVYIYVFMKQQIWGTLTVQASYFQKLHYVYRMKAIQKGMSKQRLRSWREIHVNPYFHIDQHCDNVVRELRDVLYTHQKR